MTNTANLGSTGPVPHDVVVLGSGLAASALAAVLARQGVRVAVVADARRDRLAMGEMLGRYSSLLLRMLARRYEVPELANLTSLAALTEATGATGGLERCHGFLYHRAGRDLDPAEILQMSPPKMVPPEPNLRRADVDAYLLRTARGYGAVAYLDSAITDVAVTATGVRVATAGGTEITGRYLVDAGERDSPFVRRLGLREEPTRLSLRTRSLYAHMASVRGVDEAFPEGEYRAPHPWHEGSTHHLFAGGYLAVYSFGNRPESTNHTSAVCLNLDTELFPAGESPEADFRAVVDRHPGLASLFVSATPVTEWVTADRQQYSSTRTVGDRWCVIGEAAGFVDPFLNRGLITSLELVNALAWRLRDAVRDGNFATDRFAPVERLGRQLLDEDDRLVSMIMASTREHVTWRAALALMETGLRFGQFVMQNAFNALLETGDDSAVRRLEDIEYFGSVFPGHKGYNELLAAATAEFRRVASGEADPRTAAETVLRWLGEADFVPDFFVLDTTERFPQLSPDDMRRLEQWARDGAPADVGALALTAIETVRRQMASQR